jgi:hypothetical protein
VAAPFGEKGGKNNEKSPAIAHYDAGLFFKLAFHALSIFNFYGCVKSRNNLSIWAFGYGFFIMETYYSLRREKI